MHPHHYSHHHHHINRCKPNYLKKVVFGLLVLAAGVLWLLFNLEILNQEYFHIVFSWKMLLIALGFLNLFSRTSRFAGVILIAIGAWFILPEIYHTDFNYREIIWPVALIILGIIILVKKRVRHKKYHTNSYKLEDGKIEEVNIFGGQKRKIVEKNFTGGEITNIFGGSEIDLRGCELAPGKNVLEITCVFGGVNLIVPAEWDIIFNEMNSVAGGFNDKRNISNSESGDKNLTINGTVVFGGGEIRTEPH